MPKEQKENISKEFADMREILGTIVANMVTKKDLADAVAGLVTKNEFEEFKRETRQNFRDVRNDITDLQKEKEFELDDLSGHVSYVEQKLGIKSGK